MSARPPRASRRAPRDDEAESLEADLLQWIASAPPGYVAAGSSRAARYGLREAAVAALDGAFEALARRLFEHQYSRVPVYRSYCDALGRMPWQVENAAAVPALPVEAFKKARVATFPARRERLRFHTSGTTAETPGILHLDGTALYDLALERGFRHHVLPDRESIRMLSLVPSRAEAPRSSLAYMLDRVRQRWGDSGSATLWRDGEVRWRELADALRRAASERVPVCVLASSFAWVHLLDACAAEEFSIRSAKGSRAFETGGTKGRSREIDPAALRRAIEQRLGIPATHVVGEYGMTELGSQMYTLGLRRALCGEPVDARAWSAPFWLRPRLMEAETGRLSEVGEGEGTGLLALHDLANRCSVAHLLSADLVRDGGGTLALAGRCPRAVLRGCGLPYEEWEVRR